MFDKPLELLVGFLLTSVLGGILGYYLKRRSWMDETAYALHRARYDEGTKFLDALSTQVGTRFFLMQRCVWAMEAGDADKLREREKEYFVAVTDWNSTFWKNRNRIRLLVNEEMACLYLDYADDHTSGKPNSLHYMFVRAHQVVFGAERTVSTAQLQNELNSLNWACSVFLERLTTEFLTRAVALQLLRVPTGPGPAEVAARAHRSDA